MKRGERHRQSSRMQRFTPILPVPAEAARSISSAAGVKRKENIKYQKEGDVIGRIRSDEDGNSVL